MRFSPFLAQNLNFSYSQYGFRGIFARIKTMVSNFEVCTSCKESYNVLSHSHWGLDQFFGAGVGEGGGGSSEKKTVSRFKVSRGWHIFWRQNRSEGRKITVTPMSKACGPNLPHQQTCYLCHREKSQQKMVYLYLINWDGLRHLLRCAFVHLQDLE